MGVQGQKGDEWESGRTRVGFNGARILVGGFSWEVAVVWWPLRSPLAPRGGVEDGRQLLVVRTETLDLVMEVSFSVML